MDPPKILSLNFPATNFRERIKPTILVYIFCSLLILSIVYIAYTIFDPTTYEPLIKLYASQSGYKSYFARFSLTNMAIHFWFYSFRMAVAEEFIYRYAFLLLILNGFRFINERGDYTKHFLIAIALGLNLIWANGYHPIIEKHTLFIPIFITGIPLYWLVAKTRVIWPAIACHTAFNFSLYLFIQIIIYADSGPIGQILRAIQ